METPTRDQGRIASDWRAVTLTRTTSMLLLIAGAAWCATHFMLYVLVRYKLATEFRIFMFHAVSFVAYTSVVMAWYWCDGSGAVAAGVVSVHGIYSLSFLELWSLTQGGYSLSILREIAERRDPSVDHIIQACSKIGDEKKSSRLAAMVRSGLIKPRPDQILDLTIIGAGFAIGVKILRALANWDQPG
jgi:hypothetical protein